MGVVAGLVGCDGPRGGLGDGKLWGGECRAKAIAGQMESAGGDGAPELRILENLICVYLYLLEFRRISMVQIMVSKNAWRQFSALFYMPIVQIFGIDAICAAQANIMAVSFRICLRHIQIKGMNPVKRDVFRCKLFFATLLH